MENIIKGIRQYYPVSDHSLEELFSRMKRIELPKRHLLIHSGVADRHVYFIEKGFCRSYCLRDGEEITIWFSREGDITFAMNDLYHNEPGYENVELLEDCELYSIHIEELNQIYETNYWYVNPITRLPDFLVGVLLFLIYQSVSNKKISHSTGTLLEINIH